MRVLILEDDTDQFDYISDQLRIKYPKIEIDRIGRESHFIAAFERIASSPPDIAIIDIMMPWSDQSSSEIMPQEIKDDDGHFRAGFRCARMLSNNPRTSKVVILLYSVLDKADVKTQLDSLTPSCYFVRKDDDIGNLVQEISAASGVRR